MDSGPVIELLVETTNAERLLRLGPSTPAASAPEAIRAVQGADHG